MCVLLGIWTVPIGIWYTSSICISIDRHSRKLSPSSQCQTHILSVFLLISLSLSLFALYKYLLSICKRKFLDSAWVMWPSRRWPYLFEFDCHQCFVRSRRECINFYKFVEKLAVSFKSNNIIKFNLSKIELFVWLFLAVENPFHSNFKDFALCAFFCRNWIINLKTEREFA